MLLCREVSTKKTTKNNSHIEAMAGVRAKAALRAEPNTISNEQEAEQEERRERRA